MRFEIGLAATTITLAVLAAAAFHLALWNFHPRPDIELVELGLVVAIVLLGSIAQSRWGGGQERHWLVVAWFAFLLAMPFVCEHFKRYLLNTGKTSELVMMAGLRNVALAAAVLPAIPFTPRLAAGCSLFLILFSVNLVADWMISALVILFALAGAIWLILLYWTGIEPKLPSRVVGQFPWGVALSAIGVPALFAVAAALLLPSGVGARLAGLMPASGGAEVSDPHAHDGVKDGEQLVSALEDAMSFGPVETDVFLESHEQSLYDAVNDMYLNATPPKKRKFQRAIPLGPVFAKPHLERAKSEKSSKQFSTMRRQDRPRRRPKNQAANALFYVAGPVPTHFKLESYTGWNGIELVKHQTTVAPPLQLISIQEQNWVQWSIPERVWSGSGDLHAIAFTRLKTPRVPSPPLLTGATIDRLHTETLFHWTEDEVLALKGERIPRFTTVSVSSVTPRESELGSIRFARRVSSTEDSQAYLKDYAQRWGADETRGWTQIEAVCQALRQHARHVPRTATDDNDDPLRHFLTTSRSGPDYLFAVAAALMLRELDYETRVISGYYARPERYDRLTGRTSVVPEDAHFWIEVRAANGDWIPAEPTPGFEIRWGEPTLAERLLAFAFAVLTWCWQQALPLSALAVAFIVAYRWRAVWIPSAAALWSQLTAGSDPRSILLRRLWLLEVRSYWAGLTRRSGETLRVWLERLRPPEVDRQLVQRFVHGLHWALYDPGGAFPLAPAVASEVYELGLRWRPAEELT